MHFCAARPWTLEAENQPMRSCQSFTEAHRSRQISEGASNRDHSVKKAWSGRASRRCERGRTDCERLGGEALLRRSVVCKHAVAGAALVHKRGGVAAAPASAPRRPSAPARVKPVLILMVTKATDTVPLRACRLPGSARTRPCLSMRCTDGTGCVRCTAAYFTACELALHVGTAPAGASHALDSCKRHDTDRFGEGRRLTARRGSGSSVQMFAAHHWTCHSSIHCWPSRRM